MPDEVTGLAVSETVTLEKFDGPAEDGRLVERITRHPDGSETVEIFDPDERT